MIMTKTWMRKLIELKEIKRLNSQMRKMIETKNLQFKIKIYLFN